MMGNATDGETKETAVDELSRRISSLNGHVRDLFRKIQLQHDRLALGLSLSLS